MCVREISFANTYKAKKSDYPMKNKGRYHYGLLYTLKGTEIYTFFDKTVYACPSSVLIIPKNEAYQIDLYDEESIAIAIDFELADDINIRPVFIKNIGNNNIKSLFTDAVSEWKKHDFDYIPGLKSIFYRIISFLTLQENSYHSSTNYKKIAKAIEYMNDHYLESDFKIEKLALLSGISTRYFEKLFRSIFFVTPRDYIISRKIELAKELLQSEKSSVGDVAVALGYNDIYHFSKIFKLKTGNCPREYKHKTLIPKM